MSRPRPPALEKLVFGLAFLLAGVLAYYAFQKYRRNTNYEPGDHAADLVPVEQAVSSSAVKAQLPELERSGAGGAVSGVPAVGTTTPAKKKR